MEFLISEQQLKILLQEGNKSKLTDTLKTMYSFSSNLVSRVMKVYGLNLKMLLAWGTSIAGLMMPLDNYMRNKGFDVNDDERKLILAGVIFILFFEGKRGLSKVLSEIDDQGLEKEFKTVLSKGQQLKEAFAQFMKVMKITTSTMMEVVAYCFLIPIIPEIVDLAHNSQSVKETAIFVAERLIASGVVLLSREVLIAIITKLIKKIK